MAVGRNVVAGLGLGLLVWSSFASPGRAQRERMSSLSWVRLSGAEECISTQALAQRVEARLGRPVFVSASRADLSLEGRVERSDGGWVATLVVSDPAGRVLGQRVLRVEGARCDALTASLVLVIAVGIDPDAALPAPESHPLSDETKTMLAQLELPKLSEDALRELAVPDPAPAAPSGGPHPTGSVTGASRARGAAGVARPRSSERVRLGAHTGVIAQLGVLPQPGLGLALRIELVLPGFWPLELSALGLLPQTAAAGGGNGQFDFWAVGLGLCLPRALDARFTASGCAGARAGVLRAEGAAFARPRTEASPWLDATVTAGPRLQLHGGSVWLDALASLSVPLVRDRFVYEDRMGVERKVHRPAWLGAGLALGAGLFF